MIIAIAASVLAIEMFALILFAPLGISVKSHLSLKRQTCFADIRLFGMSVIRVVLRLTGDKPVLQVNGKSRPLQKKQGGNEKIARLKTLFKSEQIAIASQAFALIGFEDAKDSAIACAVLGMLSNLFAYPSLDGDKFEVDFGAKTRVNLLQIAKILKIVISR